MGSSEPAGAARLAKAAEEKLARAEAPARGEILALLARLLALQETRRERKYGSA